MPPIGLVAILGLWTAVGGLGLVVAMLTTNPTAIGPVGVTVWFVGLFSVLASGLALGLFGLKSYFKLHSTRQGRLRYSLRQGVLVAGWLSGLMALASLGSLGWRDVILLGLAGAIIELYVRFRWP